MAEASTATTSCSPSETMCVQCLPHDILQRCFAGLPVNDLLACALVCKEWRSAASSDELWQTRLKEDFKRSQDIVGSRSGSSDLGCPAAELYAADPQEGKPAGGCGRQRYRERLEVEHMWRDGDCTWSQLLGHNDYIRCAQQRGSLLASCSGSHMRHDCSIRVWNLDSGKCVEHLTGFEGPIWSMQFDGRRVASCDDEGAVRLWDLHSHRVGVSSKLAPSSLKCLSMDARQLVVAGEDGALGLWPLQAVDRALEEHQPGERRGRGEAGEAGGLPAWAEVDLDAAGVVPSTLRAGQGPGFGCIQVDAGLCAAGEGGSAGGVHLLDTSADTLRSLSRLEVPGGRGVSTLSFQRSSGWMVAGCGSGVVRLWDLQRTAVLRDLHGHRHDVLCHQQSGARLATGSADNTVRLWDLRSGEAEHVLQMVDLPYCLQMDDWRLAVGCGSGQVVVVDLRRLDPQAASVTPHMLMPSHQDRVWALALSESRLVSASLAGDIVVRSFHPSALAAPEAREGICIALGDPGGQSSMLLVSSPYIPMGVGDSDVELDSVYGSGSGSGSDSGGSYDEGGSSDGGWDDGSEEELM